MDLSLALSKLNSLFNIRVLLLEGGSVLNGAFAKEGLIDEVHGLLSRGLNEEHVSMQGIGYKEICQYLRGELTKEESIELLKQNTRHFAKRQLTWFRRERDVIWVDKDSFDSEDAFRTDILNRIKDHNN